MDAVLGLDGGGTKTLAACADQTGTITYWHASGGLDPTAGADAETALRDVLGRCGTPVAATLGLPFHDEIEDVTAMHTRVAGAVLGDMARVKNDVAIAHTGAFLGGYGVLLLAGTGSMAWAAGPDGTQRAGGFGHIFGDEGSAYWIGRKALAHASHQIDGRAEQNGFLTRMCDQLGTSPDTLIAWTYAHANTRETMASLARHVSDIAAKGCTTARDILFAAGTAVADAGCAAASRAGCDTRAPWATAGSVFNDPFVRAAATARMGAPPVTAGLPPIGGALLDAAHRAGWDIGERFVATLASSIASHLTPAIRNTPPMPERLTP